MKKYPNKTKGITLMKKSIGYGLWIGALIGALIGGIIMILTTPEGPGAPPNFPYYIPGTLFGGLIGSSIDFWLDKKQHND